MPRSFLVKKYLKQKYESDFKLQQSLNGGSNNNNNDNDNSTSNIVSSISKDSTTIDNNKVKVQKLSDNIIARLQQQNDSGKAATPFTPSVAQPLAVRLSNGYILDVTQASSARDEGVAESSHVVARTPHQEPESAAIENQQPRRSVIVTNTNHPANRHISNSSNRVASYNSNSNSNSSSSNSFEGRYVVSSNSFLYKAPSPYHADTQTASLERPPPMAHMPSPPPAHAPVQSPLPAHTSNPSPAHTQIYTTHSPSPAHMPTPAHTKMRANSPSPAHVQPMRASSVPDVLPADHPIHHPLIQQLINQRLHVPEDNSYHHHSDNSNNHNTSIYHQPQHHQDTSYPGRSRSSSPPSYEDDNDSYYHTQHYSNDNLQRMHFTVVTQTNDNNINNSKPSENAITNQSQVLYTLSQPHHAISPTHLPPSPSPSLPSSSPTLPVVTSSLAHSPSPPSPAPSIPPPSPHTGSEVNSYTYEAFLVSDGRSRKRALDTSEDRSSSKVRYTCTECGKDYATSSNLSRHKQTHRSLDSKNAKKCPHCDKVYVSMPALSMHILTHDLKHPCTVCGKTFSRPWLLQGHMRSHTGEKPFGCAHCGKAFADRSNLRAHMQTHSAFKHFQCDKCNKNFALKSYLNKHLESACVKE